MIELPLTTIDRLFRRDPVLLADPYPIYHELREAGPILHVGDAPQGPPWFNAWHFFAYGDVAAALRDERFSSARPMAAVPLERFGIDPDAAASRFFTSLQAGMMLTMDAPDHTRLRRLALQAFTPRVVAGMRGDIQRIVDDLIDAAPVASDGTIDLMAAIAAPLPAIVIARLLGIPEQDWPRFKRWSDGIIGFNLTPQKVESFHELGGYLLARIAERRQDPARWNDLLSGLIAARDEQDALTEEELVGQCVILLVGGHETTTFAIGNALYRLLSRPERWEQLASIAIEPAVEELLRFDSPFQALSRRAATEFTWGGHRIAPGATIWLWIAAANHDPAQFPNPETIDMTRTENRHLSFGLGPHFCLGAALARLEIQIALATLHKRYPGLRLATEAVAWKQDGSIRGPQHLPVRTG
ncbi:MAG: cytochrome P450 [Thermomicrobiales bacterium]|nr:cytochrome P450 [Thermomicrobiales bacterium]